MLLASMCNKRQKVGTLRIYTVVTSLNQFERECDRVCLVFSSVYFSPIAMDFFFLRTKVL